ncbi:hypothetical protein [Agromyces sp. Soil535]|uniref:hypothetical protein n=1 Tax=Agromyces sp. Soil535 TaxID=1736390 RepID=UPI0006F6C654|nr:hypothetical protein [Agromyces sp. Soil535]KRE26244.1 hypothetical protein ASG80_05530 [Agromyces sp. Soil535]
MSIHRIAAAAAAALAAVALAIGGAAPAYAGSPHFIKQATTASLDGTSLVVDFKEAGLESGSVETIQATAHLDATYSCVNGGGNVPVDAKKTTISSDVSESGTFTAGKNGNVTGSLTLSVPAAADALDCPNGQTATLISGTWSDISIEDLTSGAFLAIPGSFSF